MKNDVVLRELRKSTIVREAKEIKITPELRARFGSYLPEITANRRHMTAYQFVYTSQGHAVVGYIVVPKKRATRAPTIVCNRGGSGEFGAIRIGWLFTGTIAALVHAGYVVIASQYSGVAADIGYPMFTGDSGPPLAQRSSCLSAISAQSRLPRDRDMDVAVVTNTTLLKSLSNLNSKVNRLTNAADALG